MSQGLARKSHLENAERLNPRPADRCAAAPQPESGAPNSRWQCLERGEVCLAPGRMVKLFDRGAIEPRKRAFPPGAAALAAVSEQPRTAGMENFIDNKAASDHEMGP